MNEPAVFIHEILYFVVKPAQSVNFIHVHFTSLCTHEPFMNILHIPTYCPNDASYAYTSRKCVVPCAAR